MSISPILTILGPFCKIAAIIHYLVGFLYLILAVTITAIAFIMDLVTWFSMHLYDWYVPLIKNAWIFFMAGGTYCS
ncbi:MAG: hypothetical protein JSR44_14000 [Spirochaetes bacterium]|nr:hypothetical protein [Spirochaetota bacterium]